MKSFHRFNIPADIPTSCLHTWQSFLNLAVSEWGDSHCFVLQKLPSFQLPPKFSAALKGALFAIFGCPKKPYRSSWRQNSIYSHTFFGGIFATYLEDYTISSCHQGSIVLLVAIFEMLQQMYLSRKLMPIPWCHILMPYSVVSKNADDFKLSSKQRCNGSFDFSVRFIRGQIWRLGDWWWCCRRI